MRNEIIQTSLDQFLKYGIRNMSVQKLVAPLGISTKTVYKHFTNKENLLREALHFYYEQHYKELKMHAETENPVFLFCNIWNGAMETETKINQTFFHDLLYYYPELNEKFTAFSTEKFLTLFIRIIERGMRDGYFNKAINPPVILNGMFILYSAVVRKARLKKLKLRNIDLLRNTLFIYIGGICTVKGIHELGIQSQKIQSLQQPGNIQEKVIVDPLSLN